MGKKEDAGLLNFKCRQKRGRQERMTANLSLNHHQTLKREMTMLTFILNVDSWGFYTLHNMAYDVIKVLSNR